MPAEQRCLTLISTASIQQYLFRSNKLKENLGASWLVADAVNRWEAEPWSRLYHAKAFIGGGNAALIFKDQTDARNAIEAWSLNLCGAESLKVPSSDGSAPGLRVIAVHVPYRTGGLKAAFNKAQGDLFLRENRPGAGWELGALPVVRPCASTGLAAAAFEDYAWLSEESAAKRRAARLAKVKIEERYGEALINKFEFPDELDKLVGTEEGASQIAIVHADGNGVGQTLQKIVQDSPDDDEQLVSRFDAASRAVSILAQDAFRQTLLDLTSALPKLKDKGVSISERFYPLRPIVDGGDDLTFVCHGRLGLALAVRYLKHFAEQSKGHYAALGINEPLTACAGVMIVPGKFPFARAYQLAEQLSTNAKRTRKRTGNGNGAGSWIDFQVVTEGTQNTLARSRDCYSNGNSRLLRRPYRVGFEGDFGWESFESHWKEFTSPRWPRSRAKRLLEALARGEAATNELLAEWGSRVPAVNDPWRADKGEVLRTPYFDPLEMLDFHIDSSLFEGRV